MTDPVAALPMSPLSSLSLGGEGVSLPNLPNADPQTADFGAILASLPEVQPVQAEATSPAPAPTQPDPALEATPEEPAATLPETGKILPPRLPLSPSAPLPDSKPADDEPEQDGVPIAVDRAHQAKDNTTPDIALPASVTPELPTLPVLNAPPSDESEQAYSPAAPDRTGTLPGLVGHGGQPVILSLVADKAAPHQRATEAPRNDLLPHTDTNPQPRCPLAERPSATAHEPDRPGNRPSPIVAIALRTAIDQTRRDEVSTSPAVATAAASHVAAAHFAAVTAPSAPSTPYDFAALVDRLAAAREAVQPQAVSVALSHADFGSVRIDFRHEDGALSVSLASPDPDFAAAVAAMPAVPPTAAATDTTQAEPRGAEARQGEAGGHGFRGQSQSDRRDDRTAHTNPHFARPTPKDDASRSGIFA